MSKGYEQIAHRKGITNDCPTHEKLLSLFTHKGNLKWNCYFHLTDLQRSKRLIASFPFNNYILFYMPVTVPSAEDMPLRRKQKEINKNQKTSALTEFIFWRVAKEILMVAIRFVRIYIETNLTSTEITNTHTLQSNNFAFNTFPAHIFLSVQNAIYEVNHCIIVFTNIRLKTI